MHIMLKQASNEMYCTINHFYFLIKNLALIRYLISKNCVHTIFFKNYSGQLILFQRPSIGPDYLFLLSIYIFDLIKKSRTLNKYGR